MASPSISNFVSRKAIENTSQILVAFSQLFVGGKLSSLVGAVRKTSRQDARRVPFFQVDAFRFREDCWRVASAMGAQKILGENA
jgi:hypothetical protein